MSNITDADVSILMNQCGINQDNAREVLLLNGGNLVKSIIELESGELKLEKLDEITLKYGGRFYLAKDARMNKETFKKSDSRIKDYIDFRSKNNCHKNFNSAQSNRLEI